MPETHTTPTTIPPNPSFTLSYLFRAAFSDGTSFDQTPDDISTIDPARSQFFDVLQQIQSGKQVTQFSLIGKGHTVSVDLTTGQFAVDGFPLFLESDTLPAQPDQFQLIFYRQHTHHLHVTYHTGTGQEVARQPGGHEIAYVLGWQCTIKGKNYQEKMHLW